MTQTRTEEETEMQLATVNAPGFFKKEVAGSPGDPHPDRPTSSVDDIFEPDPTRGRRYGLCNIL